MVFLPGDHALDTNITVANVASLTMCGESSSSNKTTVVCSGPVGLRFTNMVDFKIHSLAFTSCSRKNVLHRYGASAAVPVALFLQSTEYAEVVNCSFHDNMATALLVNNTNITLAGNTEFTHNRACLGGGITTFSSNLTFTGNTTFFDNIAEITGQNICDSTGGAIYALDQTVLSFSGTSNFIRNSAYNGGAGAIYASDTVLSFSGTNNFTDNVASAIWTSGGAIYTSHNTVLNLSGTSNFINNLVNSGNGGAIYANTYSKLTLNGTVNNVCKGKTDVNIGRYTSGGGVFLELKSNLSILPNTTVYWEYNHAALGGAIYVEDTSPLSYCPTSASYVPKEECFFRLPGQNLSNGIDVHLVFKNNSADIAGSVLYGGAVDNCKLTHGLDSYNSGKVFDMIAHGIDNNTEYNTVSTISSKPIGVCPCEKNLPFCLGYSHNVYPGETFQASVVAFGQRDGTVPSTVMSIVSPGANLKASQYLQKANNTCTKLNFTVFSLSRTISDMYIGLNAAESLCPYIGLGHGILVRFYQTCPPGFDFSESEQSCVCEPRIAPYTNSCTITNGVGNITREAGQQFWVGYDDHSQSDKLIFHPLCPLKYCVSHTVVFRLNESDMQCTYNRSALLCGACKEGYSLVLGTSQCWKCTNNYHLALLILFAVMGVALVFLLFVCKLTVATGTLSGLLFYANIVGVNRTIFLPVKSTDAFSVFIAWLNLDFGIETCFYNGMDAYSKTWLQFVFPVYIWMLVGLMILVSHFSRRFANLLGNNPVSILATLILLSYTKILHTLIAVFYITYLEYPTYNRMVWLYDANIDYLKGKHIPLFLAAVLIFFFLFLPYTLLLLFGQWLQTISHLRLFSWVNSARLKPFMDSYHAPYKAKHRYWPGLLLVVRLVLLLVFAMNPQQDPSVNLLAIFVGTGILVVWTWVSGVVYKNWCLNALEGSFALNLIILTASTLYTMYTSCSKRSQLVKGNTLAVGYTSVSIALATFIGILGFQLGNVTGITQYLKRKCAVRISNQKSS